MLEDLRYWESLPWLSEVFLSQSDGIRAEKPLKQAFDNLTSIPRLIDIEKTSNLMRDITYNQHLWFPPYIRLIYFDVKFKNSMFHIKYENKNSNFKFGCQIPKVDLGGRIQKDYRTH